MSRSSVPGATYRLQFNKDFTFDDARAIIPYLHKLGITHVYASPFLKARAGSPHGYDIVDHQMLNPEIGSAGSFARYVETLHEHGMGQIVDIVPNHMGVGGDDNAWWLSVLEHGEASPHATCFDIDWHPANAELRNKVLVPFLGDHYGAVLERAELKLVFDAETGAFGIRYYEHLFPVDPRTYPEILALAAARLSERTDSERDAIRELESVIEACRALPRRTELSQPRRRQRQTGAAACKRRLAELCRTHHAILDCVQQSVAQLNGTAGRPASFDRLHHLLEAQAYRLAFWRVAAHGINYRRFFDVNGLAGIRAENREVFEAAHGLLHRLIADGQIDGLRLDHPDGLSDPYRYYCDLQALIADARPSTGASAQDRFYVVVEKILATYEHLPSDWPVAGTTGYEVAHLLNGLFVDPESERQLNRLYTRFTRGTLDFDELLYRRKKLIIRSALASELTVLANLASTIAQSSRYTRDFTYHALRDALGEVVVCFPVYRTYFTSTRQSDEDRRYVHWAIAQAKKRSPATHALIFDFIQRLLTLQDLDRYSTRVRRQVIRFALRFQQYTAPVMAKGMEDTTFYSFNRLTSLNDVGFDPSKFGLSVNAFHRENKQRLERWPQAMINTSTHDSKRSEDTRSRINVLSEAPETWRRQLGRWSVLNRSKKHVVDGTRAPSRNDEYLLYQTLVGTWPLEPLDEAALEVYRDRIEAYMIKAVREAKVHSSWLNTNEEYENAVRSFVSALLGDPERNSFLGDFVPFQQSLLRCGLLNSLSQTVLKLTIPGVPDIYQGNELWACNLVDPDNRRAVDYGRRQELLEELLRTSRATEDLPGFVRQLLEQLQDGRIKLYLTWKTLHLRRDHPELLRDGRYVALDAEGPRAGHVCAFARRLEAQEMIVVATRWYSRLTGDDDQLPLGGRIWDETWISAPEDVAGHAYRDVFTDRTVAPCERAGGHAWHAADLFTSLPYALLLRI